MSCAAAHRSSAARNSITCQVSRFTTASRAAIARRPARPADGLLSAAGKRYSGQCPTSATAALRAYRKPDAASLELVRLGSHSELGL